MINKCKILLLTLLLALTSLGVGTSNQVHAETQQYKVTFAIEVTNLAMDADTEGSWIPTGWTVEKNYKVYSKNYPEGTAIDNILNEWTSLPNKPRGAYPDKGDKFLGWVTDFTGSTLTQDVKFVAKVNCAQVNHEIMNDNLTVPTYTWNGSKCTAKTHCNNCGQDITETVEGEEATEKTTPATFNTNKSLYYHATFVNSYLFEEQMSELTEVPNSMLTHTVTSGAGQNHLLGSAHGLQYETNGNDNVVTLTKVIIDDKTFESGFTADKSTLWVLKVNIPKSFLEGLGLGQHTIKFVLDDKTDSRYIATSNFNIVDHVVIEGADGTYTKGSGTNYAFKSNGLFSDFKEVLVDDVAIDSSNYIAEEGSVKITLTSNYLDGLNLGEHDLGIRLNDGDAPVATTTLTIKEKASPTPDPKPDPTPTPVNPEYNIPKTGIE